mgnify:CR=1 FL=1
MCSLFAVLFFTSTAYAEVRIGLSGAYSMFTSDGTEKIGNLIIEPDPNKGGNVLPPFADGTFSITPAATDADGDDLVHVGRIRKDLWSDKRINLWVVADNLLKGAALNSVQIAELIFD